jgi:hypothetical protein
VERCPVLGWRRCRVGTPLLMQCQNLRLFGACLWHLRAVTKISSAPLLPQPVDDESGVEAYGSPNAKRRNASRLRHLEHRFSIDVQQLC